MNPEAVEMLDVLSGVESRMRGWAEVVSLASRAECDSEAIGALVEWGLEEDADYLHGLIGEIRERWPSTTLLFG